MVRRFLGYLERDGWRIALVLRAVDEALALLIPSPLDGDRRSRSRRAALPRRAADGQSYAVPASISVVMREGVW
jgi:hypothetical protein